MGTLSGEKIEQLLWKQGFDFKHKELRGIDCLEIQAGEVEVVLSELWVGDSDWHVDTGLVVLDKVFEDDYIDTEYPSAETEEDLVAAITEYVSNNV